MRLATIIIDNYNYARFLKDSIESALAQTYRNVEVIVVDDGSTDNSRDILQDYEGRVTAILKENGGQGSAFNRGFAASHGDVILFLDSDDILLPQAMEKAMPFFDDASVVKVHWPLLLADKDGNTSGKLFPGPTLPDGNFCDTVFSLGPTHLLSAPGCGNAWSRWYLSRVMPLDEDVFANGCDTYLFELAPAYGVIRALEEPETLYRQHGFGDHTKLQARDRLRRELKFFEMYRATLQQHYNQQGRIVNLETWYRNSWWHKLDEAARELGEFSDRDALFLLVDEGSTELGALSGRRTVPFLGKGGEYNGAPSDSASAIAELSDILLERRPVFLVFAWCSFWWLEHYAAFTLYLRKRFQCIIENERLIVFDLRTADGKLSPLAVNKNLDKL